MGKILIGTDFSPISTLAIKTGCEWGKKLKEKVNILHVDDLTSKIYSMSALYTLEQASPKIYDFNSWVRKSLDGLMNQQLKDLNLTTQEVEVTIKDGEKIEMIVQHIQKNKPSMFFVGGHPHPLLERIFLGSTTEKMIQISPVPLVIVRDENALSPKKFLFAVDFSVLSYKTLEWVKKLSKVFQAEVHLVHFLTFDIETSILMNPGGGISSETLQGFIQENKSQAENKMKQVKTDLLWQDINCHSEILHSAPQDISTEIVRIAEENDIDLVFLATHSRNNLQKFFVGSVATKIIRHSSKSLFIMNEINH